MIEQPLHYDDLVDHAKLQRAVETPICLDESITSPQTAEHAIALRSCRYVNIKVGRVGGLLSAVKIHNMCKDAGIPCWVGGMLESGVGSGISVELATLPNFKYPADIFPSKVFYKEDLAGPEIELYAPARIAPSNTPGIPYLPKSRMLRLNTIHSFVLPSPTKNRKG
jgi:O-succinylbenzoate synthase